ncbi:hypothetical protein WJX77_004162 [Trebouxia sp. C0004]
MSGLDAETSGTNRIQVLVRVRPPIGHEANEELAVACSPTQEHIQVLVPERVGDKPQLPSHASLKGTAKKYTLDACLDGSVSQESVAVVCNVDDLVDGALQGFAVTVFAFGQTGSGKTYSMIGPRLGTTNFDKQQLLTEDDGFLARAYANVFQSIEGHQSDMHVEVRASCCEVYHEQVSDLAAGSKQMPLAVRHDKHRGFFVEGLAEVPCATCADALSFMHKALTTRHIRSHRLNEYSSRGHCIMTLQFETTPLLNRGNSMGSRSGSVMAAGPPMKKYGKLVLVDLAGSERLKATGNDGEAALRETGSINRSLFTLGQVLAGLSMRRTSLSSVPPVIPYRDSTLTKLLYEGLKGNGRVLMMACCSPSKAQAEETLNTLHFASMALRVKCNPLCILDPQDKLVLNLRGTISKLRSQNKQLSTALQRSRSHSGDGSDRDPEFEHEPNIWEAKPNAAPMRHNTLDKPLATYPSLSSQSVQGIWGSPARPRTLSSLQGLAAEGSSEFMPGSLSSLAEDDAWAAQQMGPLWGIRSMDQSVDQSVPFGSSPERLRLLQHDYNTQGLERSSKNSSPKRGNLSPPRGNLSPPRGDVSPKRDVSPKPCRAGTLRGPFVLSVNSSAFSVSTLPSATQTGGAGRAAPLPGVEAFPELAAMEAEFQNNLARGPIKPSLPPDQSVLQTSSSSLGFPKGILQRRVLSLGSGPGTKGFGRNSPAAGVLDHLQMPTGPGLKFPSRDFHRVSKTLSAIPLTPKLSLPKSKAASPRAASPASAPASKTAAKAAASADAAAGEAMSQPEPRRLPHSRFTEEYLCPVVPDTRAGMIRADPSMAAPRRAEPAEAPEAEFSKHSVDMAEAETQYSDEEADSKAEPSQPVTLDTQTSSLMGQVESDPSLPLHGFRRHMSLREPDVLLQPRLGQATADDIIATAQSHVIESSRCATTDFMLDDAQEEDTEAGLASVPMEADQAASEAAAQQAGDESQAINAISTAAEADKADEEDRQYESDFMTDLVKSLSTAASDSYDADQEEAAVEVAALLQSEASDHYNVDADLAVSSTLQRVTTDVEAQCSAEATAVVHDAMASLGHDTEADIIQDQSQTIDITLTSCTSAVATADVTDQSEAVDVTMTTLTARVTDEHDSEQVAEVETVVISLTERTEAADSVDQLAAVATVVDDLRAQSADHYQRSDSLAVGGTMEDIQADAADHFSNQMLATVNDALGELAEETLVADEAEQATTAGDMVNTLAAETVDADSQLHASAVDIVIDQLGKDTIQQSDRDAATAVNSALDFMQSEAVTQYAREVGSDVDDTLMRLESEAASQYAQDVSSAVDSTVVGLGDDATEEYATEAATAVDSMLAGLQMDADAQCSKDESSAIDATLDALQAEADYSCAQDESAAIDSALDDIKSSAQAANVSDADLAVRDVMSDLGAEAVNADKQEAGAAVTGIITSLESQAAAEYSQHEDSDVLDVMTGLTQSAADAADQEAVSAVDGLVTSLGGDAAAHYRRQDSVLVNATVDALTADAAGHFAQDQSAALDRAMAHFSATAAQHYDEQQGLAVSALVSSLGAEAAGYYEADQEAAIGVLVDNLQSQAEVHEEEEAQMAAIKAVGGLAVEAVQSYDQQEAAAVAAVVTSLGSELARTTDDQDAAAVQEVISALGHTAAESELAEQRHAVHAVLASLGDEACENFSTAQEAVLQSTLQSLTKAAFNEEEADRDAAVQEVVTALSGEVEGSGLETLRSEVDSLVEELRVEVATSSAQEHDVQQAGQAIQEASAAHYSRQQSLVVDRLVDSLALEAATSYGGTRKPAVAQALKKQLHKAAQKLPSLAAASAGPLVSEPEVVVVSTAVVEADGAADGIVMKEAMAVAVVAESDAGVSAESLPAPIEGPSVNTPMFQQLLQQLPEPPRVMPRLHSLDSINALVWPTSRRVSSAGSRASSHLRLYVDDGGDHLHLYVDHSEPQLQQGLPPQPMALPRLRTTASINTLVWPTSRPDSSRSSSSQATAVEDTAEVASTAATAAAKQLLRPLPSAASIDELLWPGDTQIAQRAALPAQHADVQITAADLLPVGFASRAAAELPVRSSATFRAQKQQSLLDRAAAKRALAALLAAAKASQIRGWSPKQRALSPAPPVKEEETAGTVKEEEVATAVKAAVKAPVGLPSLEDIEALVPLEEEREEPEAAQPAEVATEVAEVLEAPAVEAEPVADAVVGPSEADKALAEQQERDSLEVLEEAIQAAALEADFTFPDDVSSSNGDQSLVIDDIIESLESDALEAEQEALAVQQAEAAAQAKQQAEEDARAAERAQQQAQAAIKAQEQARAARQAGEAAQAVLTAREEARAARQAEEEAHAALKAERQARAALQAELEAQSALRAEEAARAARQAEEEAMAAQQAKAQAEAARQAEAEASAARQAEQKAQAALKAEEEAEAAAAQVVEEAEAAAIQAEEEAKAAALRAEEEAEAATIQAEKEAKAAALRAEEEAKAAAIQAEKEAQAAALRAEEEAKAAALKAEQEAQAARQAEEEAQAAALKVEGEAQAAAVRAEKEARAAAEMDAWAASLKAQEEARMAAVKTEEDARAACQAEEDAKALAAVVLAERESTRSASRHQEDFAAMIDQQQAVMTRKPRPSTASKALPSIKEEVGAEVARRSKTPTGKEKLAEDYPGLEPAFSPVEPLFKFKGQALMHEDSSAGTIRAAPGMAEVAVYNMAQTDTFRPLGAAVSISPRSRLSRTQSSLGPGEADRVLHGDSPDQLERAPSRASFGRAFSSISRTRSSFNYADPASQSLMQRTGSSIAQYDAQGNLVGDAPEPQALQWAARNPWFGTDAEMTYYAYEVHDHLIEAEGYDPNSKEYYEQIGLRVAAQFPERYAERSPQPTPRLSDVPPVVTSSLRQLSVTKSGRILPFDASSTLPTGGRPLTPPTAAAAAEAAVETAILSSTVVKRNVTSASSSGTGSSYTSSSYTSSSGSGSGSGSSYTRSSSSGSYVTGSGSGSESRSVSGDGSGSGSASSSGTTSARTSSRSASFSGSGSASGSRTTYSQSGTGSDSRTISASSYSSARSGSSYSSLTTDSKPVTARLPAIAGAQPKGPAVVKTDVVVKNSVVKQGQMVAKGSKQRPDSASSSGSESGSDSSYSSGSSYSRSDSYTSRSSSRPNELPKLPNLPATRQKAEAYQNNKAAAAAAAGKPVKKKMVVAGTVTKSSRVASRAASDSGSSSSSYTSGSTSRSNAARSSKLPAIAASKGAGAAKQSVKSNSKVQPGATSVQQQTEVMRSDLQQSRAATSQEQARIKNTIQQQLQPGRMLF